MILIRKQKVPPESITSQNCLPSTITTTRDKEHKKTQRQRKNLHTQIFHNKMGIQQYNIPPSMLNRKDYVWDDKSEPHIRRRVEILRKYPQIKELFGPDPSTKYIMALFVIIQLVTCYYVRNASWLVYIVVAYVIGGTMNNSCTTAIHETTHNLVFESSLWNNLMALFVNFPMGIPVAMAFKKYHHEHHLYQVRSVFGCIT
jgi:hypothetical protein